MFDAILPIVCLIVSITLLVQAFANKSLKNEIKSLREQIQQLREQSQKMIDKKS
jgi:cell division protein FtsB